VDGFVLTIWILRLLFLALLYLFLFAVVRVLLRDLRGATRERAELGRLVVIASPGGEPPVGAVFPLDAIASLGRDVNNTIVVDDPFASGEHAAITFRGRSWYVEDLDSTNGTYLNGTEVAGATPMGYGDEVQIGEVRLRLERGGR
jgi:hypothetical protein